MFFILSPNELKALPGLPIPSSLDAALPELHSSEQGEQSHLRTFICSPRDPLFQPPPRVHPILSLDCHAFPSHLPSPPPGSAFMLEPIFASNHTLFSLPCPSLESGWSGYPCLLVQWQSS